MATGRKKVTIQYRKLDVQTVTFPNVTLQTALENSTSRRLGAGRVSDSAKVRQFETDKTYGTLVLNFFEPKKEFFFGEMVRFEPGADLALLAMSANVQAYQLTQSKAPSGHEPIRGVLYFMVIGNHVTLIESDVSSARLEIYLTWLLSELTDVIPKGAHLILDAELDTDSPSLQLSEVDKITFKPQPVVADTLRARPPSDVEAMGEPVVTSQRRLVAETSALNVLRAAGMDDADIQNLVEDNTELELTLQIKLKGHNRRKPLGIVSANRLLRNVPEDELTLEGRGGRQRSGRIVKLAYPASIETVGALFTTKDVARGLLEAYRYFLSNGHIEA